MDVKILNFPATRVAAITHTGSPSQEHETARKLIAWKIANRLLDPVRNRSYGLHYADPHGDAKRYRVDFCLSVDGPVARERLPAFGTPVDIPLRERRPDCAGTRGHYGRLHAD